jgi:hypothetical protein
MRIRDFLVNALTFLLVGLAFLIMLLGGLRFLIISLVFFGGGGLFEWMMMRRTFVSHPPKKKKGNILVKISEGVLWVHQIVYFIVLRRSTIYHFKTHGYLPSIFAYLTMLIYVLMVYLFYQIISYWAFILYAIPVITNLWALVKYYKLRKRYKSKR